MVVARALSSCGPPRPAPGSRAQAQWSWRMGLVAPRHAGSSQETGIKPVSPWVGRQTPYHSATQGSPQAFYLPSALPREILEFPPIHPLFILFMVSLDTRIKINAVTYVLHFLLQSLSFLSQLSLCYPCSGHMVFYFQFC